MLATSIRRGAHQRAHVLPDGTRRSPVPGILGPSPRSAMIVVGESPRRRLTALATLAAAVCCAILFAGASSALAQTTTFSNTQTIPVPPASNYAGSGGGDGWAIALSNTQVFNVFHHQNSLQVVCHNQSDASTCWGPTTITDANSNNFASSGQPGMYLDQKTGKLYVYATRQDGTGGVVCVDTTKGTTSSDPFCGFTQLTATGEASLLPGWGELTNPVQVGSHLYAFNYVPGANVSGTENKLLCFDVSTDAACAGQPFQVSFSSSGGMSSLTPAPGIVAINSKVIIEVSVNGTGQLTCFDDSTQSGCSGSWPASAAGIGSFGDPFALVDANGSQSGVCLPDTSDHCWNLSGASVATPAGMQAAVGSGSVDWNGPGYVLGPRVYVPAWTNTVYCYDASTQASCTNFPKQFGNLSLLYTVNPDPQRPTCLWVNADNGSAQIQNFDAFSGGACGQGPIRVLASQFIVPQQQCFPTAYQYLQIQQPAPGSYTSGSVQFLDSDGNPIPGASDRPIDTSTGKVDLSGLSLDSKGLPQFLITLNGAGGNPTQVVVKLVWTATYDPSCVGPGTTTQQTPATTTTSLSGAGHSGANISVPAGTAVTDAATLSGTHASSAGGTVKYTVYSDNKCTSVVSAGSNQNITTPGQPPPSSPVTLSTPGTYYWVASYSGDGSNFSSQSNCGDEVETVTQSAGNGPTIDGPIATGQGIDKATASVSTRGSGDLLVAFVRAGSPSSHGNGARVSGGGLTWTRVGQESRALGDAEVWTARATGSLSSVPITAMVSYEAYTVAITVIPFANSSGIGVHRKFYSRNGLPAGVLTTTQANSWVFAAGDDWLRPTPHTAGAGQTIQQQSQGDHGDFWVQSTNAPTPAAGTPVPISDTTPSHQYYDLVLVEVL